MLLNNAAIKIFAVDVGFNQIDEKIKENTKVINIEKTNARYLDHNIINEYIDLIVCDASFISLTKILPTPLSFAKEAAFLIALIKPQFEAGRKHVSKGGIIQDPEIHRCVCEKITGWLTLETPWTPLGIQPSPITGPKGNREFLIAAQLLY